MIPVFQAAVERAHLALQISGLGRTPEEIILRMCPAEDDGRMLEQHYIRAADPSPPPPGLDAFRRHGFTVEKDSDFTEAVGQLAPRRGLLLAMVRAGGWFWDSVQPPDDADKNHADHSQ